MILKNVKWGTIRVAGLSISPLPKGAQDRCRLPSKQTRAGYAPGLFLIAFTLHRSLINAALTRLPEPIQSSDRNQVLFKPLCEGQEVVRVIDRIQRHLFRERPPGPVCLLRAFGQF